MQSAEKNRLFVFNIPFQTSYCKSLVGGLEHFSICHSVGNVIIPIDVHIFQRGGSTTNQISHLFHDQPRIGAFFIARHGSCLLDLEHRGEHPGPLVLHLQGVRRLGWDGNFEWGVKQRFQHHFSTIYPHLT